MYDELRKEAKKTVDAKMAFYTCSIVFSFTSLVLMIISLAIPAITLWLMIPIPVFLMVLGVLYLTAFGLPGGGKHSDNWKEEEIKKEMRELSRSRKSQLLQLDELSDKDRLQLKELERLEQQWGWDDDLL